MKILYIVPNVPSRVRVRPFNLIRRLTQNHEVSVLCLATNEEDRRFAAELPKHCPNVEIIWLPRWRSVWNCFAALFSSKALRFAYFYAPSLRRRVVEKVSRGEVDLVHAEHLKSVPMVQDVVGKVPMVFDAVDCVSMFEARRRRVIQNPFLKVFFWMEWKKMAHWEAKACQLFNRTVITSPVDKGYYPVRERMLEKIDVVPNGVDLGHFGFKQYEPEKNLIIFCGNLDYFPNRDAVLYFARSVWPILRSRRPELRFEIVGSRPPWSVRRLSGIDNVRVVASVPDVRPHLGCAWVALCPIRLQAGIQNKILEAMALGVPVVATRTCVPGLGVEPGKHVLVADQPEEIASAVELLLDNHTLRASLVEAARKYVEQHVNWDHSVEKLLDSYAEAMKDFAGSKEVLATVCLESES